MSKHPLLDGMIRTLSECDGDIEEQARRGLLFVAYVLDDATRNDALTADVPEPLLEIQRAIAHHLFQASVSERE